MSSSIGLNLSSMGLKSLQYEPQRLENEAEKISDELEGLVLENYRVFVENLNCSVQLRSEDKKIATISSKMATELRDLSVMCSSFRERVHNFVSSHKRNRKTLQYHMQLVELLEVPQLVDACSRNGFYDEALELANFVNSLARRHNLASEVRHTNSKDAGNVIQGIVNDVYDTLINLRSQLLQILTENITLPKEIQIISTIRKLDALFVDRQMSLERGQSDLSEDARNAKRHHILRSAEMSLQMEFLEARSIWMEKMIDKALHDTLSSQFSQVDTNSFDPATGALSPVYGGVGAYARAMEILELNRSAWFSVVTQYNALFSENTNNLSSNNSNHHTIASDDIITVWINRQVQRLLQSLSQLLPLIEEGASLRSVMEQSLGFAHRMSQVGCDFSASLIPLFEVVIINKVLGEWQRACKQFKDMISFEKVVIEIDDISREQIIPLYLSQEESDNVNDTQIKVVNAKKTSDEVVAPTNILNFPPLAYLLNSILGGINFLRDCPLKAVNAPLQDALKALLNDLLSFFVQKAQEINAKSSRYLGSSSSSNTTGSKSNNNNNTSQNKNNQNQNQNQNQSSKQSLDRMYASCIAQELLPHILLSLELLFPHNPHRKASISLPVKIQQDSDLQGSCSNELFAVLQHSWNTLRDHKLLDRVQPVVSVVSKPIDTAMTASNEASKDMSFNAIDFSAIPLTSDGLMQVLHNLTRSEYRFLSNEESRAKVITALKSFDTEDNTTETQHTNLKEYAEKLRKPMIASMELSNESKDAFRSLLSLLSDMQEGAAQELLKVRTESEK